MSGGRKAFKFKRGDRVHQQDADDGPVMIILSVTTFESPFYGGPNGKQWVEAQWFDADRRMRIETFPAEDLEILDEKD